MHDDLRAAVAADMPRLKDLLFDLVRLESVSADGYDPANVRSAGETIVGLLDAAGFDLIEWPPGCVRREAGA